MLKHVDKKKRDTIGDGKSLRSTPPLFKHSRRVYYVYLEKPCVDIECNSEAGYFYTRYVETGKCISYLMEAEYPVIDICTVEITDVSNDVIIYLGSLPYEYMFTKIYAVEFPRDIREERLYEEVMKQVKEKCIIYDVLDNGEPYVFKHILICHEPLTPPKGYTKEELETIFREAYEA